MIVAKFKQDSSAQTKKPSVIAAFKRTCNVSEACRIAEVERSTHYAWLKSDPAYKEEFESSRDEAAQILEDEAVRRAEQGVDEPVFYKGEVCGSVRKYSDTLLIFLLNGAMPDKYKRERAQLDINVSIGLADRIAAGRKRLAE